jgi:hypothetical protein
LLSRAQKGERQPANHLVSLQGDGDEGVDLAEQSGCNHRYQHTQPGVPGGNGDTISAHRAHQHHTFDAQVHHARTLGE